MVNGKKSNGRRMLPYWTFPPLITVFGVQFCMCCTDPTLEHIYPGCHNKSFTIGGLARETVSIFSSLSPAQHQVKMPRPLPTAHERTDATCSCVSNSDSLYYPRPWPEGVPSSSYRVCLIPWQRPLAANLTGRSACISSCTQTLAGFRYHIHDPGNTQRRQRIDHEVGRLPIFSWDARFAHMYMRHSTSISVLYKSRRNHRSFTARAVRV